VRVFVSYRRSDVSGYSGRLTDALGARLGVGNVFHDVTGIAPGRDFQNEIDRSLATADAVLAMIGPGWLTASTPQGDQRLFQDGDFVRTELSRALTTNLPLVPVLVGGVTMPRIEDLPADLAELTRRQAIVLRDESFHADVDRLLRSLRGESDEPPTKWPRRRKVIMVTSAVLFALISIGGVTWLLRERGSTASTGEPTMCPSTSSGNWHSITLAAHPSATVPYMDGGSLMFTVNAASWRQEQAGRWVIVLGTQMKNNAKTDVYHDHGKYRNMQVALREFKLYCFNPPEDPVRPALIADARVGFIVTCPPDGELSLLLEANNAYKELPFTKATTPESCLTSVP
jgi:hypothetical protein